jgi:DNA gyrase subunit B
MTEKYDGDSIETLEWPECVKKRPGMYIGGSGVDGMHHLLWEIFDNATDEAVAGHCTNIVITNEADGYITVLDDGRGIPCDINKKTGRNALELVVAQLHAGGKFHNEAEDGGYKVSGGLHGCGAAVCNALSEHFQVFVRRSNRTYTVEYWNGTRTCEVHEVKDCPVTWLGKTGTFVRFRPDRGVFKHCRLEWERARVLRRARETAFLVSGLSVTLRGWKGENEADVTFKFEKGLHDYVTYLFEGKERLTEDFELNVELPAELGCTANVVFAYEMKYDECLTTFANNICTFEGGVHREAFLSALLKVVVEVGEDEKLLREFGGRVKKSDVTEGFIGVVSIRARQPEFEGQTKTKLGNPELRGPLEEAFLTELRKQFKKRKEDFIKVSTKVIEALKARDAAMKAKELTRKKGGLERFAFQGKLAACESNDPSCCEVYLCEGDCFAPDTLVHTDQGLKRLDEINDNDLIYTHNHRFRRAKVLLPKIKRQKCRVTLQGHEFTCSADHLFLIMRCNDGIMEWVPAKELKTTDLIVKTCVLEDEKDRLLLVEPLSKLNILSPSEKEIGDERNSNVCAKNNI